MSYIISYVGAGGKTSSIYQDAAAFVNEGKKVMITTTTHMYVPKDRVFIDGREKSCEKLREEVAGILKKNGICVCGTILSDNKKTEIYAVGKCAGNDAVEEQQKMEPEKFKTLSVKQLTAVCKEADVVLIEADGAAHKAAKAPEAWEPPKASTATSSASQTFMPESRHMTHTAPPVPKEPSTVRSATSRMR